MLPLIRGGPLLAPGGPEALQTERKRMANRGRVKLRYDWLHTCSSCHVEGRTPIGVEALRSSQGIQLRRDGIGPHNFGGVPTPPGPGMS